MNFFLDNGNNGRLCYGSDVFLFVYFFLVLLTLLLFSYIIILFLVLLSYV